MSENNKSYRIKANINKDTVLNVDLSQDYNIFEVLSLKVTKSQLYKFHTSKYGCLVGRVVANGNFGIPNAKVSVFVEVENSTMMDSVLSDLYPYASVSSSNSDGIRYNLLPDEQVSSCHAQVGTFPNKRLMLDDDNILDIFDKYYRYTTRTNDAGDYMIFGVPVGQHILHVDIDLSDIGILSQKPRDLIAQGYNINQFENANQFRKSTDLDNLSQIITQNISINVMPFWGDNGVDDDETVAITRQDVVIEYKFQPTCVFMGSIISDDKSNGISKECIPTEDMGKMKKLTTGNGTIEMIRKTSFGDNDVEELRIEGTQLIDGNGTWCYNIPMNLDYMMTDEYGNMVPTDDPSKGIPTRTRVRFRFSLSDFDSDYANNHLAKVLVPNNPKDYKDLDYAFGSYTKDDEFGTKSFRDLFWNNVYTVKSYIPRIQNGDGNSGNFTGIKQINVNGANNPIPYNNIRIHLNFSYVLQCAMLKTLIAIAAIMNKIINVLKETCCNMPKGCITVGDGICPDLENWYFAPSCNYLRDTLNYVRQADGGEARDFKSIDTKNQDSETHCITKKIDYLMQCIEIKLALETDTIEFDFFNDWINGLLYIPRWFIKIRHKRSFLFGLIHIKQKMKSCMDDVFNKERRIVQQCNLEYTKDSFGHYTNVNSRVGCRKRDSKLKCHKGSGRGSARIFRAENKNGGGIVHGEPTIKKQTVYYFKPTEWISDGGRFVKANLFATDIVLLGSLNDCDKYGLPQAFKSLSSSSFKMPTSLALTNLQTTGYMYGHSTRGIYCDGINNDGIQVSDNTYAGYKKWANGTEFAANVDYDVDDYAVTEASGIDWGYSGPGQKENDNQLYNPGGHFLGISCTAAQTNIKSCINLSRVCEIGADISQRQPLVINAKRNGENKYLYGYLIPTGVITKIDVADTDFRRMFATLNYNNLRTEYDEITQTLKYKITPLNVNDFNGELNQRLLYNSNYNIFVPQNDNTENDKASIDNLFNGTLQNGTQNAPAYTYTVDTKSSDYYNFRFGVKDGEDATNKYLQKNQGVVSMPVYENSYYFYFGLKDGNTAFDRFLTNYFSPCDEGDSIYPGVETVVTNCLGYSDPTQGFVQEKLGEIKVIVSNFLSPYTITLVHNNLISPKAFDNDGEISISSPEYIEGRYHYTLISEYNEITITELPFGSYSISTHNSTESIEPISVTIEREEITQFKTMDVIPYDYRDEMANYDYDEDKNGYFKVIQNNEIYPIIISDINHCYLYYSGKEYQSIRPLVTDKRLTGLEYLDKEGNLSQRKFAYNFVGTTYLENTHIPTNIDRYYVWCGNNEFTVSAVRKSSNGSTLDAIKLGTFTISMPSAFDYYIGHKLITGKRLDEFIFKENNKTFTVVENWLPDVLQSDKFTATEKSILREQLQFNPNKSRQSITVGCINGVMPYTINVYGNGEKILDSEETTVLLHQFDSEEKNAKDGFLLDIASFIKPTDIGLTGTKYPYLVNFSDSSGKMTNNTNVTYNYDSLFILDKTKEITLYLDLCVETIGEWYLIRIEEGTGYYGFTNKGYEARLNFSSYEIGGVSYPYYNREELDKLYLGALNAISIDCLFRFSDKNIDFTSVGFTGVISQTKPMQFSMDLPTKISIEHSVEVGTCLNQPKSSLIRVVINNMAKIIDYNNTEYNQSFGTDGRPSSQDFIDANTRTNEISNENNKSFVGESIMSKLDNTKKYIPLHCPEIRYN